VVQDNQWDGGFLDIPSQVAQESPISQQLSWPRTSGMAALYGTIVYLILKK